MMTGLFLLAILAAGATYFYLYMKNKKLAVVVKPAEAPSTTDRPEQ